jgi:hypothetical protein
VRLDDDKHLRGDIVGRDKQVDHRRHNCPD